MFSLTSSATKLAIIALSAGLSWTAFDAVTQSFQVHAQAQAQATATIELPTVVVIGYRATVTPDTMQAATKVAHRSSI